MDISEWKRRCIEHFKSGDATPEQWQEMAEIMLFASEDGNLDAVVGLDLAIDQSIEEEDR